MDQRVVIDRHLMDDPEPLKSGPDGLNVAAWRPESDDAPWVIAIHDLTANLHHWGPVAEALAGRVGLVGFDLRGRAGSRRCGGGSGLDIHAQDVLGIAETLGAGPVGIVGHGYGGAVAIVASRQRSLRDAHLILIDGPVVVTNDGSVSALDLAMALDPSSARVGATFANRDAYLAFWRGQPWFTSAGTSRLARRALLTDLTGSGFGWQVQVAAAAVDRDVTDYINWLGDWDPNRLPRHIAVRATHGYSPDDGPLNRLGDAGPPLSTMELVEVDTTHAGILLEDTPAKRVADVIVEVVARQDG